MTHLDSANGHFSTTIPSCTPEKLPQHHPSASQDISHDLEKSPTTSPDPTMAHAPKTSVYKALGWLDRLLALWILLAIIIGILIGNYAPHASYYLNRGKFVDVSVPVAIGLLVMMYPILCKVRYESLHHVFRKREVWRQLLFSIIMNWIIAPFVMVSGNDFVSQMMRCLYQGPAYHMHS